MDKTDRMRQMFLIGTLGLGVLIIAGLVWAVVAGSGQTISGVSTSVVFNDEGAPVKGPAGAKVTVRIFSDFQCPACKVSEQILEKIMAEYEDRVLFVWQDFPLSSIHPNALPAAMAARCAQEQSGFWNYASILYRYQTNWSYIGDPADYFAGLAEQSGLSKDEFAICYANRTTESKVKEDYAEAVNMGLDATPTYFINKKMISGAIDEQTWRRELDQALGE